MLTAIRERITGWFAWMFIILLCFVFALWGIEAYFQQDSEYDIATINDEGLPLQIYRDQLATQQQTLAQRLGNNFDINSEENVAIKQQVLDSLINDELLRQYARNRGLRISDTAVQQLVLSNDLFFENGQFNTLLYENVLANNRLTPQTYENLVRSSAEINQLQQGIIRSAFYVEHELDTLVAQEQQVRIAEYVEIPVSDYLLTQPAADISEQQVNNYYQQNQSAYATDPKIKVEYIELTLEDVIKDLQLDEQEIQAHYETTKARYTNPEVRKVSHILINVDDDDAEAAEKKLELANALVRRLADGEDFTQLVKQYSDDAGSKDQGGDIGVITQGQVEKSAEDAIYAMQEQEVSQPIKTRFGYQIFKLTSLEPETSKSLQDVRHLVKRELERQQADQLFPAMVEQFKNLAFEEPDSIDFIAESLELKVRKSDWFSQSSGSGVFADQSVRNVAFADDVLSENLVSAVIEISPTNYVALQKLDYQQATTVPLQQVRDQIVERLNTQQAQKKAQAISKERYSQLLLLANTETGWKSFLQQNNFVATQYAGRKSQIPNGFEAFGDVLFELSVPVAEAYQYGHVMLPNGNALIFALQQAKSPETNSSDYSAAKNQLAQQLIVRDGVIVFSQFIDLLKDEADIVIYEDQL